MGIGRPNMQVYADYAGGDIVSGKFVLHMEIPDLTPDEVTQLTKLLRSKVKQDRKDAKTILKNRLEKGKNTKGGHKLLDGIPDDPADDNAPAP